MNYPSVKLMMERLKITREDAKRILAIMEGKKVEGETRLQSIDAILGNCGVEYIPTGHNVQSPAIYYSNTGDSYGITVLKINEVFKIGSWGDIVERGNYD